MKGLRMRYGLARYWLGAFTMTVWFVTRSRTDLLGVIYNDSPSAAGAFARADGLTYPILEDPSGTIANDFGVVALPVTIVIDARGVVTEVLQGAATTPQLVAAATQAMRKSA